MASAYPIESRDGHLVEPAVVKVVRQVLGRDPRPEEAFRYTAQVRSGMSERKLRDAVVDSDAMESSIKRVYRAVRAQDVSAGDVKWWRKFLRNGGTYERFVSKLAG